MHFSAQNVFTHQIDHDLDHLDFRHDPDRRAVLRWGVVHLAPNKNTTTLAQKKTLFVGSSDELKNSSYLRAQWYIGTKDTA